MKIEDILRRLHEKIGEELLTRIESGEADTADFTAAIKFLKDNGIDCRPTAQPNLLKLDSVLKKAFEGPDNSYTH